MSPLPTSSCLREERSDKKKLQNQTSCVVTREPVVRPVLQPPPAKVDLKALEPLSNQVYQQQGHAGSSNAFKVEVVRARYWPAHLAADLKQRLACSQDERWLAYNVLRVRLPVNKLAPPALWLTKATQKRYRKCSRKKSQDSSEAMTLQGRCCSSSDSSNRQMWRLLQVQKMQQLQHRRNRNEKRSSSSNHSKVDEIAFAVNVEMLRMKRSHAAGAEQQHQSKVSVSSSGSLEAIRIGDGLCLCATRNSCCCLGISNRARTGIANAPGQTPMKLLLTKIDASLSVSKKSKSARGTATAAVAAASFARGATGNTASSSAAAAARVSPQLSPAPNPPLQHSTAHKLTKQPQQQQLHRSLPVPVLLPWLLALSTDGNAQAAAPAAAAPASAATAPRAARNPGQMIASLTNCLSNCNYQPRISNKSSNSHCSTSDKRLGHMDEIPRAAKSHPAAGSSNLDIRPSQHLFKEAQRERQQQQQGWSLLHSIEPKQPHLIGEFRQEQQPAQRATATTTSAAALYPKLQMRLEGENNKTRNLLVFIEIGGTSSSRKKDSKSSASESAANSRPGVNPAALGGIAAVTVRLLLRSQYMMTLIKMTHRAWRPQQQMEQMYKEVHHFPVEPSLVLRASAAAAAMKEALLRAAKPQATNRSSDTSGKTQRRCRASSNSINSFIYAKLTSKQAAAAAGRCAAAAVTKAVIASGSRHLLTLETIVKSSIILFVLRLIGLTPRRFVVAHASRSSRCQHQRQEQQRPSPNLRSFARATTALLLQSRRPDASSSGSLGIITRPGAAATTAAAPTQAAGSTHAVLWDKLETSVAAGSNNISNGRHDGSSLLS
ncbi:hypothetical protein Emed_005913 [Eimeria media]